MKKDQMPLSGEFLSWRAKQKLEPSLLLEDGTSANRVAKRNGYHHKIKRNSIWEITEMTAEKIQKSKRKHRNSCKIILSSTKI